jgi:hypothetical protein
MKQEERKHEITGDQNLLGNYDLTDLLGVWRIVRAQTFQDHIYFLLRFVKDEMRSLSPRTRMHLVRSQRLIFLHP